MARPNECDGCRQAHACREPYRKLGCDEGPSLTFPSLVAFMLPLAIFVAALGGWGYFVKGRVVEPYQTPLTLVLALATTAALMLGGRLLAGRRRK